MRALGYATVRMPKPCVSWTSGVLKEKTLLSRYKTGQSPQQWEISASLADTAHIVACKSHAQPQSATELRHKKAWRPRDHMTQETQEIAWSISECNRVQRQGRKGDSETRKAGRLRNEESRKTQRPNNSGRAGEFLIHLRFSEFFPKNWTMINAQTLRLQACFRRNCSGMEEWGLELLGTVSIKAG